MTRYWLKIEGKPWKEVSKQDFIAAERENNLHGPVDTPATSGFSILHKIEGRLTKDKYSPEVRYKDEPDFLALLKKPSRFPLED